MTQEQPQQTEPQGFCHSSYYTQIGGKRTCVLVAGHKSLCTDNELQWERKAAPPATDDVEALFLEYERYKDGTEGQRAARHKILAAFARLKEERDGYRDFVPYAKEYRERIAALERENERLQADNARYAQSAAQRFAEMQSLTDRLSRYQSHCESCREYQIEALREGGPLSAEKERG